MDNSDVQLVGGPCGQHGPYTFYKAFKYTKNGIKRIVTLSEFFFVKLWIDSDLLCIGELQLLWSDKNSDQVLASLRLYFLPENTPDGRMDHGEDEVLAISEKVVLKVEDLITWITVDAEWTWGRLAKCENEVKEPPKEEEGKNGITPLNDNSLDFSDVENERKNSDCTTDHEGPLVVILSYPRYCRYRAMMRRLEGVENDFLKYKIVNALGGFTACTKNTRVLFCKDTFDYPELEGHELLCNHLAPKLKGRPRGKRKKRSVSPGSESNESESSVYNAFSNNSKEKITSEGGKNGIRCDNLRRSTRAVENSEGKEFMKELTAFMKTNYSPIGKIPSLGYKELDLYAFYTKVQKLGGYDVVTTNRLWKTIFDDMNGHVSSTSAATVIRRHYERFLLPYERHLKGEEYKPLPISERRRLKSKTGSSASDAETSESTSRSGNSTPIPQSSNAASSPTTPTTPTENKEFSLHPIKSEAKTSSALRSVRVKPERQKDKQNSDNNNMKMNQNNNNNDVINNEVCVPDEVKVEEHELVECESKIVKIENATSCRDNNDSVKVEINVVNKIEVPDKDAEPVTSAIAPIAHQKTPEKSHSPVEGKENIPIIQTGNTPDQDNKASAKDNVNIKRETEIIEVPYKPKSPEIIDLESESSYNATSKTKQPFMIQEVKKRKLEILKEGGLEVTPVRNFNPSSITSKDTRPSVIQPTGAQIIAKPPIKKEVINNNMPPPSVNTVPSKRSLVQIPQALNISHVSKLEHQKMTATPSSPQKVFQNTPPKVLQSKSIYSYSEKTVYGNPKDYMTPPPQPALAPKFLGQKHGGDILDLTVTSPQKPVVEIMKVPNITPMPSLSASSSRSSANINRAPVTNHHNSTSLLDGRRLGSNLEITIVNSSHNNINQANSSHVNNNHYTMSQNNSLMTSSSRYHQHNNKRYPVGDIYPSNHAKLKRIEPPPIDTNNGKFKQQIAAPIPVIPKLTPQYQARSHQMKPPPEPKIQAPKHYASTSSSSNAQAPPPPQFNYLSHLYDRNKSIPNYLPLWDPYYSAAIQNLYPHSISATPSVLPFSSSDQLKYYTELMARTSRISFPIFPMNSDTNPSISGYKKS